MQGVNKAILVGHLGADPDIRTTQDGRSIANLSLATSKNWKDRDTGEKRERTQWHRVVIFNDNLAKLARQALKKGSKLYVEGEMMTRKWTDNNGIDRFTTEVVLQGFSANMVLLDKREGSAPPPADPDAFGDMPPGPDSNYGGFE